jgi:hypothetical protein
MLNLPDRFTLDPRSGRPAAPDSWARDGFAIVLSRLLATAIVVAWAVERADASAGWIGWQLLGPAAILLAIAETKAFFLRRRRVELAEAIREFDRAVRMELS